MILNRGFMSIKNLGDIRKIDINTTEPVDVIFGGSPCQNLSVAGNKKGLGGEQSCLFFEQIRIVRELREKTNFKKPRYMVWENVAGALSCNKGNDFKIVLQECINVATREDAKIILPEFKEGKWPKSGLIYDEMECWSIAWRVHDAQYWGVPQRRRRIALVADFGGMSASKVLFESKSVSRNSETCDSSWKKTSKTSIGGSTVSIFDSRGNGDGKIASTLTGDHDSRITDYTNCVVLPSICIGNGQSHVVEHYTEELCQTLNCMHDPMTILEPTQKKIAYCIGAYNSNSMKSNNPNSGIYEAETCRTLDCVSCGSPVCNQGGIAIVEPIEKPFVVDRAAFNQGKNALYEPSICESECSPTLVASGPHAVSIKPSYRVRRLTPLECERLQGFPDDWTNIGDWTDLNGKKRKLTDAQRYKALGNSIALPFWKWLIQRIVNELKESNIIKPTMGSLFDGIGGFPLCWFLATNKKETIRWISEIEDFPIAVTQYHF